MTEKERNEKWTKQALSHTDWNGRSIAAGTPIVQSNAVEELPDKPQVTTKAYTGKGALEKVTVKSMFADAPVVNAFTDF